MSSVSDTKVWRTDDMALATFLILEGHDVQDIQWELESCYFAFVNNDGLNALVSGFVSGSARVEPRNYNMAFGKLKRAMFSHPEAPRNRGR